MAEWIQHQKQYYKNKSSIFENQDIRLIWEQFVSKYDKYKTIEDKWIENLQCVKDYVKLNKKLPPRDDNDDAVRKLSNWVNSQKQNYKNKTQILNNEYFYKLWDEFIGMNYVLFKSNEEIWYDKLNELKTYIENHNKKESTIALMSTKK